MWVRHTSRTTGQDYLYRASTGETKWCDDPGSVARAYGAYARAGEAEAPGNRVPEPAGGAAFRHANNAWKRDLVDRFARNPGRALDAACGRGGDVHKLVHAGARRVLGLDVSPDCVAEARRRHGDRTDVDAVFHVADLGVERIPAPDASCGAAVCNFALHYLADDPGRMGTFLGEVARVLRPGAALVVTVPVVAAVRAAARATAATEDFVRVTAPRGVPDDATLHAHPWGHAYVYEFVGRTPPLPEFLVHPPALEDLAADHGLVLEHQLPCPHSEFYTALVFRR